MKARLIAVLAAIFVLSFGTVRQCALADGNERELIWSDEFDGDSLNRDNWNVEVNGYGGWNDELQYYCDSPENITVSDGTLKITALKKHCLSKEYTITARLPRTTLLVSAPA